MKQVTKYEATDGQLFNTPDECEVHESRLEIKERIDKEICAGYRDGPTPDEIFDWVVDNTKGFK